MRYFTVYFTEWFWWDIVIHWKLYIWILFSFYYVSSVVKLDELWLFYDFNFIDINDYEILNIIVIDIKLQHRIYIVTITAQNSCQLWLLIQINIALVSFFWYLSSHSFDYCFVIVWVEHQFASHCDLIQSWYLVLQCGYHWHIKWWECYVYRSVENFRYGFRLRCNWTNMSWFKDCTEYY